ncbi:hypothetical protein [Methylobacterium goesingense]|uniref:Transposase n=1 Tax=Methylobacterium goesingense TaxID=243690 RepID=A0ABV2LCP7_9HYPH|nr:hypothetical protein [Methylobacterium goesingense]GJD76585.1 hypothetical protein CFIICLFH_4843 [Methylobacterium goesingense]
MIESYCCELRAAYGRFWQTALPILPICESALAKANAITIEFFVPEERQKGFAIQPWWWVIECTFDYIGGCRRLARDHEATTSFALAFFIFIAAMILIGRLNESYETGS